MPRLRRKLGAAEARAAEADRAAKATGAGKCVSAYCGILLAPDDCTAMCAGLEAHADALDRIADALQAAGQEDQADALDRVAATLRARSAAATIERDMATAN